VPAQDDVPSDCWLEKKEKIFMELNLKNKVVVVTGGARGIGKSIAEEFANEGSIVAVCDIQQEQLDSFLQKMKDGGHTAYGECVDVTDNNAMEGFAARIVERYGRIDVWVNNAGVNRRNYFDNYSDEDWNFIVNVNLKAVFNCSKIAAKQMKTQNSGVIVNISSYTSIMPTATSSIYGLTKAAVVNFVQTSAAELAPYNIRVVGIAPGYTRTDIAATAIKLHEKKLIQEVALKRLAEPVDIAKPVVFLASDAAGYITGLTLPVTGGKYIVQNSDEPWKAAGRLE
jgi:NAD(P)-dependent dehydrogenase (short-subunit alcohol dehydrogenase family)